jgi:dephospho-CoA kinase
MGGCSGRGRREHVKRESAKHKGLHPTPLRRGLYVIGLTGNIATGKSAVAAMLSQLGARVIDADALAHQVMSRGTPAWHKVVEQFGRDILREDEEIDRTQLGARAFAESAVMSRLEAIVHPAVIAEAESLMQNMERSSRKPASDASRRQVAVLEAIKLIESAMHHRCDEVWVVTCPREQQVQRLMETRGLSRSEAELRIDAQPLQQEKIALANVVIDNSGELDGTRAQVQREWERIVQPRRRAVTEKGKPQGGRMSALRGRYSIPRSWRDWMDEHPFLSMWVILAVGMVAIFLVTARDVDLLLTQRLFMAAACVVLAGLCTWIVSWE